jgi:hypothetical protein
MLLGLAHFDAFRTWFRIFGSTPSVIPSMISFDKADKIFYITAFDMIISIRVGTIRERDRECCTCPCTSRTHVPIAGGIS